MPQQPPAPGLSLAELIQAEVSRFLAERPGFSSNVPAQPASGGGDLAQYAKRSRPLAGQRSLFGADATEESRKQADDAKGQKRLFDDDGGKWITIGGHAAGGAKHAGGTPVKIDEEGNILAGGKWLKEAGVENLADLGEKGGAKKEQQETATDNPAASHDDPTLDYKEAKTEGARRSRPVEIKWLDVKGPSGARLTSYEWKWRWDVSEDGEDDIKVSDWSKAETNEATGNKIVHAFSVHVPGDEEDRTVSLETAVRLLGYADSPVGAMSVRNLAHGLMQLAFEKKKLEDIQHSTSIPEYQRALTKKTTEARIEELERRVKQYEREASLLAEGSNPEQHYRDTLKTALHLRSLFFMDGNPNNIAGYIWGPHGQGTKIQEITKRFLSTEEGKGQNRQTIDLEGWHALFDLSKALGTHPHIAALREGKTPAPYDVPENPKTEDDLLQQHFGPQKQWSVSRLRNWFAKNGNQLEQAVKAADKWLKTHHPYHPGHVNYVPPPKLNDGKLMDLLPHNLKFTENTKPEHIELLRQSVKSRQPIVLKSWRLNRTPNASDKPLYDTLINELKAHAPSVASQRSGNASWKVYTNKMTYLDFVRVLDSMSKLPKDFEISVEAPGPNDTAVYSALSLQGSQIMKPALHSLHASAIETAVYSAVESAVRRALSSNVTPAGGLVGNAAGEVAQYARKPAPNQKSLFTAVNPKGAHDAQGQKRMFEATGTHWVTIGGHAEGGKKHAGGTPVEIDGEGNIVTGPQWLKDAGVTSLGQPGKGDGDIGEKLEAKKAEDKGAEAASGPEATAPEAKAPEAPAPAADVGSKETSPPAETPTQATARTQLEALQQQLASGKPLYVRTMTHLFKLSDPSHVKLSKDGTKFLTRNRSSWAWTTDEQVHDLLAQAGRSDLVPKSPFGADDDLNPDAGEQQPEQPEMNAPAAESPETRDAKVLQGQLNRQNAHFMRQSRDAQQALAHMDRTGERNYGGRSREYWAQSKQQADAMIAATNSRLESVNAQLAPQQPAPVAAASAPAPTAAPGAAPLAINPFPTSGAKATEQQQQQPAPQASQPRAASTPTAAAAPQSTGQTFKRTNPPQVAQPTAAKRGVSVNTDYGDLKGTEYIVPGAEEYRIVVTPPGGSKATATKRAAKAFEATTGLELVDGQQHGLNTEQEVAAKAGELIRRHGKQKIDYHHLLALLARIQQFLSESNQPNAAPAPRPVPAPAAPPAPATASTAPASTAPAPGIAGTQKSLFGNPPAIPSEIWRRTKKQHEQDRSAANHRDAVQAALAAGKPVPPQVLAEYPDLAQSAASGQRTGQPPAGTVGTVAPFDQQVGSGTIVKDQGGNEFMVMGFRSGFLQTVPIVNGKPVVGRDVAKTFRIGSDEEDDTADKVYKTGRNYYQEEEQRGQQQKQARYSLALAHPATHSAHANAIQSAVVAAVARYSASHQRAPQVAQYARYVPAKGQRSLFGADVGTEKRQEVDNAKGQKRLFASDGTRWITIGGHAQGDAQHAGGTHVKIDESGKIVAGGKWLREQGVENLSQLGDKKPEPEPKAEAETEATKAEEPEPEPEPEPVAKDLSSNVTEPEPDELPDTDKGESGNRDIVGEDWLEFGAEDAETPDEQPEQPTVLATPEEVQEAVNQAVGKAVADFGEHIPGARKEMAITQRPRSEREEDPRPAWARRYEILQGVDMTTNEKQKFFIFDTKKQGHYGSGFRQIHVPTHPKGFDTEEEAIATLPLIEVARNHVVRPMRGDTKKFAIYRRITESKFAVVKDGFDSDRSAMQYMAKNPEEIINHKFPEYEDYKYLTNVERTGPERKIKDVSPDDFQKKFKFRGGQFGKWMENKDGQTALNHAYDALGDLADVLGLPPEAISMNGDLGIGFGARGRGGKGAALAHYERDLRVINLTKMRGAGTLAHEYGHAFDHYLGKLASFNNDPFLKVKGNAAGMLTEKLRSYTGTKTGEMRPELVEAFKGVLDAMHHREKESQADIGRAQLFLEKRIGEMNHVFNALEAETKDPSRRKGAPRRGKPFTAEQQSEWDSLKTKLMEGDPGPRVTVPTQGMSFFYSYENIKKLNDLYKSATGRSFVKSTPGGWGDQMYGIAAGIRHGRDNLKRFEKSTVIKGKVTSDFVTEARNLDLTRGGDYYTLPSELFARAFESYVQDKIESKGQKSQYLVAKTHNFYYPGGMKPYPEGEERQAINAAFDKLFETIKHEESEDGKKRMYQQSPAETAQYARVKPLPGQKSLFGGGGGGGASNEEFERLHPRGEHGLFKLKDGAGGGGGGGGATPAAPAPAPADVGSKAPAPAPAPATPSPAPSMQSAPGAAPLAMNPFPGMGGKKSESGQGEQIGKGSTGPVFRHGNEVRKSSNSVESKIYGLLKGAEGVAPGRHEGGQIVTPFYSRMVSVDDVPREHREGLGGLIQPNLKRIASAITHLSNTGHDYNDPLQFGLDDNDQMHLMDFSNAQRGDARDATDANLNHFSNFLHQFGLPRHGQAVGRIGGILRYLDSPESREFVGSEDPDASAASRIASNLGEGKAKNAYYTFNARTIPGVAQSGHHNGVNAVFTESPLSDEFMDQWELHPALHTATPAAKGSSQPPASTPAPTPAPAPAPAPTPAPTPKPKPPVPAGIEGVQKSLFGGQDMKTGQKSLFNVALPSGGKAKKPAPRREPTLKELGVVPIPDPPKQGPSLPGQTYLYSLVSDAVADCVARYARGPVKDPEFEKLHPRDTDGTFVEKDAVPGDASQQGQQQPQQGQRPQPAKPAFPKFNRRRDPDEERANRQWRLDVAKKGGAEGVMWKGMRLKFSPERIADDEQEEGKAVWHDIDRAGYPRTRDGQIDWAKAAQAVTSNPELSRDQKVAELNKLAVQKNHYEAWRPIAEDAAEFQPGPVDPNELRRGPEEPQQSAPATPTRDQQVAEKVRQARAKEHLRDNRPIPKDATPFQIQEQQGEESAAPEDSPSNVPEAEPAPEPQQPQQPEQPAPEPQQAPQQAQQTQQATGRGTIGPGTASVSDLQVDPQRFQYKLHTDNPAGVTQQFADARFNPELAGTIHVWEDPEDGKTYVVNGHHRFELAQRSGYDGPLEVYRLKAGSAQEARAKGALVNIAGGNGTAIDAAKFMRDTGTTPEEMNSTHGVSLKGPVARDAAVLSKLSPGIFRRLTTGIYDEGRALAIARHLPNHEDQDRIDKFVENAENNGRELSNSTVEEMAREAAMAGRQKRTTKSLFGDLEDDRNLFVERATLKGALRRDLAARLNKFKAVATTRAAKTLEGKNQIDAGANRAEADRLAQFLESFDMETTRRGPVSDRLNQAAQELASAPRKQKQILDSLARDLDTLIASGGGAGGTALPGNDARAAEGVSGGRGGDSEELEAKPYVPIPGQKQLLSLRARDSLDGMVAAAVARYSRINFPRT